ncbi:MAG: hypothetical protein M0038_00945 [Pseudomonadota bacterium]|jgi:hypothetical protein|nr:hypothetical protein [Pseudomonadota bacterium]
MNTVRGSAPSHALTAQVLAAAALASWTVPLWCFRLRFGTAALRHLALPVLLGLGVLSAILHLVLHRHAERFGIFFPAASEPRGSVQSIRLTAVLLLVFNLGAAGFVLHDALSHTTLVMVILLSTVSAMNLTDECWIARRRRLNRLP